MEQLLDGGLMGKKCTLGLTATVLGMGLGVVGLGILGLGGLFAYFSDYFGAYENKDALGTTLSVLTGFRSTFTAWNGR